VIPISRPASSPCSPIRQVCPTGRRCKAGCEA